MTNSPADQVTRLKKLYDLSMTLSGDPMDIFVKVARIIGEIMDVKVVCLSEIEGGELHFLSVFVQGKIYANAGACPLDVTPCSTVERSKDIKVYENVMELFPEATFLKTHNAYSYCGFPSLRCNGDVVAVTCLLDDRPREFTVEDKELLQIFGQRIGLEIERKHLQDSRQAMVAALEYSEQRFRDIAMATGELVWEVDVDGKITYLSDLSMEFFGCLANDLMGKNLLDVLSVNNAERDFAKFIKLMAAGCYSDTVEHQCRLANGKRACLRVKSMRILDKQGRTIGYRGAACDMTDSKRIEKDLILERDRLRRILDSLSVFVALLDCDGKVIEANRTPWAAAAIRREDYIGIQFGESLAWAYDPEVHAQVRLALVRAQQGETVRYDVPILMANGLVDIDFTLMPLFDKQGRIDQIVACGIDISIRKKALEALRRSEERLELAISSADLGLWDWDIALGGVVFSERWGNMLGYTLEEIQPCYAFWECLVHPDDLPNVRRALNASLDAKTPFFELEYRLLAKNSEWKWILGKGKVVKRDAEGKPIRAIGIDMDISSRKDLEERLRQRQEELYYAQRLTAAGELTAIVAHEINQPLGAISNYIGGALLRFPALLSANPSLAEVLKQTLRLSQRAMAVIRGIRALVRKQKEKLEWVSLEAVVDAVLPPLRAELSNKQVKLIVDIPSTLPLLWCEQIHLEQLLFNLILNAIQAMDTPECPQRKLIVCANLTTNHRLKMTVSDTGLGIAPEIAEHLFEPFISTKAEGIGLGLSICRTITEAYGGHISVRSMPRQGTAFEVVLPFGIEKI